MSFCLFAGMMLNGQALKVDASGNVGIGTGTPNEVFEINHPDDATMRITEAGSTTSYFSIREKSANQVQIEKVAASGESLIDINPKVTGNADAWFRFFRETNTGGKVRFMVYKGDNSSTLNSQFGGNQDSYLNKDFGNVGIGLSSPQEKLHVSGIVKHGGLDGPSDRRLKRNIKSLDLGLAQIMKLKPVSYIYNGKGGITNDKLQYGLIAQEVQKVIPEVVREWDHIVLEDETDKVLLKETYLSLQTDAIQYVLVNAVKEQQAQISELEKKNDELKEMVENLVLSIEKISTQNEVLSGQNKTASLGQNVPNPFNGFTEIAYFIPESVTQAQISITSVNGQVIKNISINNKGKGVIKLTASDITPGNYFYSLILDGKAQETKHMVLMR